MATIQKLRMRGFKSFPKLTELPFEKGFSTVLGPNGSGKSTRGDTQVLLASGELRPIKELVEDSLASSRVRVELDDGIYTPENPLGISILGLDTKSMKIVKKDVSAFIKRDGEPHLYTIITKTGREVTTTGCHPVMTFKDGKVRSEVVKNLEEGNFISTPNKLDFPEKDTRINITKIKSNGFLTEEIARFFGYLVGDGCIIPRRRIDFVNSDDELLKDYINIVTKFGLKPCFSNRKGTKAICIYVNSKEFSNALIKFFKNNYKKEKKHIPSEILFSRKKILANFLAALFDCDSSLRKDNPTFEYVTMSQRLADNVLLALLRYGIVARKTKKIKYASNTKDRLRKEYYFITIEGKGKLKRLYENIPLRCKHKKELLKKWADRDIIENPNIDVLPQEVNKLIRECREILCIGCKPLRKKYPRFAAYNENRCCPTRQGLKEAISIFEEKIKVMENVSLELDQKVLMRAIRTIKIPRTLVAENVGVLRSTVTDVWDKQVWNAKPENLEKLYLFLKKNVTERLYKAKEILSILINLANSDIFWDQIVEIRKVNGEKYVYDLSVPDCHNFVGNGIFVHNSNVMDAFCFVLGKTSAKSMRAEKSANLIYNGGKKGSPAKDAQVDIFFNNNDKSFPLNEKEIKISRIVRQSGQSIYKINDKTKTRQEILELLNTAKIDPDGHNIILQGDIVGFMEMRPLDRRLLIEEIAGISVYEDKKEKALRELEKVRGRLNEVEIILTEREANLRELKKDRDQAKRFKELEEKIKDNKATFLHMLLRDKKEKKENIEKQLKEQEDKIKDAENKLNETRKNIDTKQEEINAINVELDEKGEKEQVSLRTQITDLKTDSVKNETRIETLKAELKKIEERNNQLKQNILEVNDKVKELRNKKKSLENELNEVSKKIGKQGFNKEDFEIKLAELTSLKARQSNFTIFEDVAVKKVLSINGVYGTVASLGRAKPGYELPLEVAAGARNKSIVVEDDFIAEKCIETLKKDKLGVLTFLPLNKIKSYEINDEIKRLAKIQGVHGLAINLIEFESKFRNVFNYVYGSTLVVEDIGTARKVGIGRARMVSLEGDLTETSGAMIGGFRKVSFERRGLNKRILELEKEVNKLKNEITDPVSEKIRERTFEIRSEIRTIENQIDMLEDENERVEKILKEQERERTDFKEELNDLMRVGKEKESNLKNKEKDEKIFYGKFKAFVARRNKLQELIGEMDNKIREEAPKIKKIEERRNDISINRAKVIAEMEGLEREFEEFKDGKIRKSVDLDILKKEINDFDKIIRSMGNVNLRALEIYEDLRKEYDKLLEKANKLKEEKEDVFKVISEIDLKKTESFMETFKKVSINFRAIFGSLSSKGEALLELENKEKPLEGGLDIKVRIKSNKFMDIHGLSGGEKTLAALAFIFAIQDFQPASFYLLDEVDAALDKHNSEKLSELIKKYSDKAQYIVISHNDAIISSADQIFGVSMQEGVSKIVSLRI